MFRYLQLIIEKSQKDQIMKLKNEIRKSEALIRTDIAELKKIIFDKKL
jgi:hypothetical protein